MIKPTGDRIGNCKASHGELGEHPRGERLSIGVPRSGCSPIPDVCGLFNVSTYEAVLRSSHATVNKVTHFPKSHALYDGLRGRLPSADGSGSFTSFLLHASLIPSFSRLRVRVFPRCTCTAIFVLWYFGYLPQPRELDICCRRKSRLFLDTFWKILVDGPFRLSRFCGMRKERDSDD